MVVVCETIINRNMNSEVIKATKSVQKELSDKHFQCDKCKKLFKCKVFQEEHILVVHGKEKSCMCDICQKSLIQVKIQLVESSFDVIYAKICFIRLNPVHCISYLVYLV